MSIDTISKITYTLSDTYQICWRFSGDTIYKCIAKDEQIHLSYDSSILNFYKEIEEINNFQSIKIKYKDRTKKIIKNNNK